MKLIAIIDLAPGIRPEQLGPHMADEARAIWSGIESGLIRQIHYRTDKPGAVIEFEAANDEASRAFVTSLPMARAGLVQLTDLIPLGTYTGLASLFSK